MAENCKKSSVDRTSCVLLILLCYVLNYAIASDTNERTVVASSNGTIIDLDYHYSEKLVFWIDGSLVYSADLTGSAANSTRVIINHAGGAWEPLSLAVDYLSDRLYVADALGRKVDAFSLKGKNHIIVAAEDFERPSGVVLDPQAALMFVADGDKIVRMNLDGSARAPVIRKTTAASISALAIDRASKTLAWWDSELRAIESSTYIGESRHVVRHDKLAAVTGLARHRGRVYFLDGGAVFRVAADDRRAAEAILTGGGVAASLRAIDPDLRRSADGGGACEPANGGCQHACLAISSSSSAARCRCYAGNLLAEDARGCTVAEELLLYSHKEVVRGRGLAVGAEIALSFASPASLSLAVDGDFEARVLYFADASNNTIYKGDLKTGETEGIVAYEGAASISLDWASRNLYYSDFAEGSLNVVSLRNHSHRRRLLDSLNGPGDVIAHPARGHVYFYDDAKIKRVNADGTKLTTIHTPMRHRSLKLAVDFADERLYWCLNDLERASRNSTVQHSSLDGSGGVVSLRNPQLRDVSAMAVHGDWIYVIAAGYEKLARLRKRDGRQMSEIATAERQAFYALAVMRQAVKLERSPCASASACDKLCFAVPRTKSRPGLARQCACPRGERLVGRAGGKRLCKPERAIKELALVHRCEPAWEFACRNGRCIPRTQLCDGVNDCLDRSDERGCAGVERNYFIAGG